MVPHSAVDADRVRAPGSPRASVDSEDVRRNGGGSPPRAAGVLNGGLDYVLTAADPPDWEQQQSLSAALWRVAFRRGAGGQEWWVYQRAVALPVLVQVPMAVVLWVLLWVPVDDFPSASSSSAATSTIVGIEICTRLAHMCVVGALWMLAAGREAGFVVVAAAVAHAVVAALVRQGAEDLEGRDRTGVIWASDRLAMDIGHFALGLVLLAFVLTQRRRQYLLRYCSARIRSPYPNVYEGAIDPVPVALAVTGSTFFADFCCAAAALIAYEWVVPIAEEERWKPRIVLDVVAALVVGVGEYYCRIRGLNLAEAFLTVLPLAAAPAFLSCCVGLTMPFGHHAAYSIGATMCAVAWARLTRFRAALTAPWFTDLTQPEAQRVALGWSCSMLLGVCISATQFVHAALACAQMQFRLATEVVPYNRLFGSTLVHLVTNAVSFRLCAWALREQGVPSCSSFFIVGRPVFQGQSNTVLLLSVLGLSVSSATHFLLTYHILSSAGDREDDQAPSA